MNFLIPLILVCMGRRVVYEFSYTTYFSVIWDILLYTVRCTILSDQCARVQWYFAWKVGPATILKEKCIKQTISKKSDQHIMTALACALYLNNIWKRAAALKKAFSTNSVWGFFKCFIRYGNFNTGIHYCSLGQWLECLALILTFRFPFPVPAIIVERA